MLPSAALSSLRLLPRPSLGQDSLEKMVETVVALPGEAGAQGEGTAGRKWHFSH